jgi:hypothetical protein
MRVPVQAIPTAAAAAGDQELAAVKRWMQE